MISEQLAALSALKQSGNLKATYIGAVELAQLHPEDVRAQIAAAYACDSIGFETEAVNYYESAWGLGIAENQRFEFLVGYSSTLRNVGRAADSLKWLCEADKLKPGNAALLAFRALALHSLGKTDLALGTMLDAALKAGDGKGLSPYTRALTEYRDELTIEAEDSSPSKD